ncbi:unnamed protein product [Pelagomonas calceolata]|uniref:Protein-tyrosine sulfotransferase n=1 Tax=Pelagomonas calceolata TaxID=35677 RepID=A0A8J2SXJ9_9STRA|nr:unnamed protein product [Pelagomonas calceolata]|mmetsp:Transcript_4169/g.11906  ORF Transcript_4169/g.11906 Transcript_4169/m.11906 type:complete len:369 (+) Transcript_4169:335-1441(+)
MRTLRVVLALAAACASDVLDAPTFFFIGSSKCATSSIAAALARHPAITSHAGQGGQGEAHVFDGDHRAHVKNAKALLRRLQAKLRKNPKPGALASMEYTPEYLFEANHVPACLCGALQLTAAARCANRRFLVTLREPVARAVSSWQFKSRAGGGETRSFRRVVEEGAALARGMRACLRAHGGGDRAAVRACPIDRYLTPPPHGHHQQISLSHVGKGLYVYQLRAWFARVPRERFLVVPIEQFYANATDGLARVLAFVGVPALGARGFASAHALKAAAEIHVNDARPSLALRAQVTDALKEQLAAVYAEPNCELDRLLGFATGYCARARKRDAAPGVVTERAVAKQASGTRTGVSVKSASIRAVAHSTG